MTDMVTPSKKIVLNIMHDKPKNFLNAKNNASIKEQEKLNKTLTEYSEDEEIPALNSSLEEPKPEKNRQIDYNPEFKVFDESTKMQIEENNHITKDFNEARIETGEADAFNFFQIDENNYNNLNKIDDNKISFKVSEHYTTKILNKSPAERKNLLESLKEDLLKQEDNDNKTESFFFNDETDNLNNNRSSNNLIPQNLNLFQADYDNNNNKKDHKITQKLFVIKDNISETNNVKHDYNFTSNEPKKDYFAEQEEKIILSNFVPERKKEKKSVFNLEFVPSNDTSNLDDNLNSGTIYSNNEDELDDENTVRIKKYKNTGKDKKFDVNFKTGRWTNDEHVSFLEAIFHYNNNWKKVQKHIRTRSSTQARSHAQKFFISLKKKIIEDLNNPSAVDMKKVKNRNYLEESVQTLFINKIYSADTLVKDQLFYERKDKLIDLINTLLISNTKNKRSFFKCIDSKEQTRSRKNSLKRFKIKEAPESLNTNDLNFNSSLALKPLLSQASLDGSKIVNYSEINNTTRNNSNANLLSELVNPTRNNINFNSDNSSMFNLKSSMMNDNKHNNGVSVDNNFHTKNFPMEFAQGLSNLVRNNNNNSHYYVNFSENKADDKRKFGLDFKMNKLSNDNTPNNNQIENKITTSNLINRSNPNQILYLSQSYTLNKNGNLEMNNSDRQQGNKNKEFLLSNNKIEDLSFKNQTKKDSIRHSNNEIIVENVNNKSNNSIVNLGAHSFSSKDPKEIYNNLKVYKHDATKIYNSDNINISGAMKNNVKMNVYSKFKNDNFVLNNNVNKKKPNSNDLTIEEGEKSFSKDIKYDAMNNFISDIAQESFKESFNYKENNNNNNLNDCKNIVSLGKSMSYVENRKYDDYDMDIEIVNNNNHDNDLNKDYLKHNKSDRFSNLKIMKANNSSPVNTNNYLNFCQQKDLNKYNNHNSHLIQNSLRNNPKDIYNLYFDSLENKNVISDKNLNVIKNSGKFKEIGLINNPNQINTMNRNYVNNNYQYAIQPNISNIGQIISYSNRIEKIPDKEAFKEKNPYVNNNSQNLDTFDFNNIERSIKNNPKHTNLNKSNLDKNNLYKLQQIPNDKGDVAKMKFQSFNIDLIQDISKNIKSCGKLKNSDKKTPSTSVNTNYNTNFNNFYLDNNNNNNNNNNKNSLDKSRFLQIFNNNLDNGSDKAFNVNKNINYNDKLQNSKRDLHDKVLNQDYINAVNNQDFSKNKLLSNIGNINKEANINEYLNIYQKPNQNEPRVNNTTFNGNIDQLNFYSNEFKNKQASKINNNLLFNNYFHNNKNSYQKDNNNNNINEYTNRDNGAGPANYSNDFLNNSKNFQNNNFTNLNHNNYINILNINVVHPKETNLNPSNSREFTGKQDINFNKNFKDYSNSVTTMNNVPLNENKNQLPKWSKQKTEIFNAIPTKINLNSCLERNQTFKSPANTNLINNQSANINNNKIKNNKSIFDDNIITINTINKANNNNNNFNSNSISNISTTKQISNTNDVLNGDFNKTDFFSFNFNNDSCCQLSTKIAIEKNNNLANKNIITINNHQKGVHKESRDDTLNPFNINFVVEEDKRLIVNTHNNDCFNSFMNISKEEDEFLGFDMFPN